MLEITIPKKELFLESTEEFLQIPAATIQLEHSLISLRKWEAKWHKAFLKEEDKTYEELVDYIRCMTLNKNVDPIVYDFISEEVILQVMEYIKDPMTATTFTKNLPTPKGIGNSEFISAEIIYYWMIALNIPSEYQKWHLNQLMALIKVVNLKSSPAKKMGKREAAMERSRIFAERRAKYKTKG